MLDFKPSARLRRNEGAVASSSAGRAPDVEPHASAKRYQTADAPIMGA